MRKSALSSFIIVGCLVIGVSHAQAPTPVQPVDVVAVRQAAMGVMYGTWRGLRNAVEAKAEPKGFILAAKGVAAMGRQIPVLFPPAAGVGRLGLPAMLEDRAGFEQAAATLTAAGEGLLKVAQANDVEAFPNAVRAVSNACGGCHPRKYADDWTK